MCMISIFILQAFHMLNGIFKCDAGEIDQNNQELLC